MTQARSEFWFNFSFCVVLAVLLLFAVDRLGAVWGERGLFSRTPQPDPATAEALAAMQMEMVALETAVGGNVRAGFVLYNGGQNAVRDLRLLCEFFDGQERYVGRQFWLLPQHVAPGAVDFAEASARFFVPQRAENVQCQLIGLDIAIAGAASQLKSSGEMTGHSSDGQH